jgi:hypothetical protein
MQLDSSMSRRFDPWPALHASRTLGEIAREREWQVVTCDKCGRTGRYRTARLVERYELDFNAVEWLRLVSADCPRRQAGRYHDWCEIHVVLR